MSKPGQEVQEASFSYVLIPNFTKSSLRYISLFRLSNWNAHMLTL